MLSSLRIQKFRAFHDLKVPKLGRVNLIVGRNGVGKTTLLEAVRVYAAGLEAAGELTRILEQRQEIPEDQSPEELDLSTFHSANGFAIKDPAQIGPCSGGSTLELQFSRGVKQGVASFIQRLTGALENASPNNPEDFGRFFERALSRAQGVQPKWIGGVEPSHRSYHYLQAHGMPPVLLGKLWDRLILAGNEQRVLEICKTLLPTLEMLSLVQPGKDHERVVVARLADTKRVRPLRSFGEGTQRAFELALGLACAQHGFLLLDEFENGLHYSIQEELWRFVFEAAVQQDIQVFATTHSNDCVRSFQRAADSHPEEGVLIRLYRGRDDAQIHATMFDEADMQTVAESDIEVRG